MVEEQPRKHQIGVANYNENMYNTIQSQYSLYQPRFAASQSVIGENAANDNARENDSEKNDSENLLFIWTDRIRRQHGPRKQQLSNGRRSNVSIAARGQAISRR